MVAAGPESVPACRAHAASPVVTRVRTGTACAVHSTGLCWVVRWACIVHGCRGVARPVCGARARPGWGTGDCCCVRGQFQLRESERDREGRCILRIHFFIHYLGIPKSFGTLYAYTHAPRVQFSVRDGDARNSYALFVGGSG